MFVCRRNFAIIALVAGGMNVVIPPSAARADSRTAPPQQCLMMLRVVDVPPDDVLYIRKEPRVPEADELSNQLVGIPASARWIEDLGPATADWRRVRYMGVVGFARGRYLARDLVLCLCPCCRRSFGSRQL